jgi:hypothetical protein
MFSLLLSLIFAVIAFMFTLMLITWAITGFVFTFCYTIVEGGSFICSLLEAMDKVGARLYTTFYQGR